MQRAQQDSIAVIALMLTILLIAPTQSVLGQGRAQKKPQAAAVRKIATFKVAGAASRSVKELPPKPPPALGPGVMSKLIGKEPGSLYVRLTPSKPKVVNRGVLEFVNPDLVDCGDHYEDAEGWVLWHKKVSTTDYSEHYMLLWIRSSAGSKYLIDCSVVGDGTYKVVGPDHSGQIIDPAQENGHLVFLLDTTSAGWFRFEIFGFDHKWSFHSCEVTNL